MSISQTRFKNDDYPLIITIVEDDFASITSFKFTAEVDNTFKDITSTTYNETDKTVTFDTTGVNAEIFDTVGKFDIKVTSLNNSGQTKTYDFGTLTIKDIVTLTLLATIGDANANTYVTLEESNTYFEYRLHTSKWDNSTNDEKARALATATSRIDYESFDGSRVDTIQNLAFPRKGMALVDGLDYNNIIPKQIKEATYELAIHLIGTDMSQPSVDTSNLKSFQAGSFKVGFAIDSNDNVSTSYDTLPPFVESLLDIFSDSVSSGAYVSVVRG